MKKGKQSASTLAICAFSDAEANSIGNTQENKNQQLLQRIRHKYFKIAVYSMFKYFANVLVYVSSHADKQKVASWSLPLLDIVDLTDVLAGVPPKEYFHDRPVEQLLPKYSFLDVANKLESSTEKKWKNFSSLFYTEGDQVVHVRKLNALYKMLEASNGTFVFIPHRLQTLPLFEDYPAAIQKVWQYRRVQKKVDIVYDEHNSGSCCDNGRLNLPKCGNWWYFCDHWGVQNYTTWLKFHKTGFVNPLVTEHEGFCSYTPRRIKCPLPTSCKTRFLQPLKNAPLHLQKYNLAVFLDKMSSCREIVYNSSMSGSIH